MPRHITSPKLTSHPLTSILSGAPWQGHGHVMWIEDGEIALEMRCASIPHTITDGYVAEFVWKSTSYDR